MLDSAVLGADVDKRLPELFKRRADLFVCDIRTGVDARHCTLDRVKLYRALGGSVEHSVIRCEHHGNIMLPLCVEPFRCTFFNGECTVHLRTVCHGLSADKRAGLGCLFRDVFRPDLEELADKYLVVAERVVALRPPEHRRSHYRWLNGVVLQLHLYTERKRLIRLFDIVLPVAENKRTGYGLLIRRILVVLALVPDHLIGIMYPFICGIVPIFRNNKADLFSKPKVGKFSAERLFGDRRIKARYLYGLEREDIHSHRACRGRVISGICRRKDDCTRKFAVFQTGSRPRLFPVQQLIFVKRECAVYHFAVRHRHAARKARFQGLIMLIRIERPWDHRCFNDGGIEYTRVDKRHLDGRFHVGFLIDGVCVPALGNVQSTVDDLCAKLIRVIGG